MTLVKVAPPIEQDVDLTQTYDAVIVGSGAAGGMAAHVLTSRGMKVLMLEAGKKLDINQELRSMQWPYDHPRRGDAPPGSHHLSFNEYTIRKPPFAKGAAFKHVYSYVGGWGGSDYVKNILVDEKDHPYTGSNYAWVRARCLGGKTNIWGRLALRLSDYDFKAKTHDGYGEDWPIAYADLEPYYDKVDLYLGISGVKENLPHLPDSQFQRPSKLNWGEVKLRESLKKAGQVLTPYRAGVTTDGLKHNKYRSKCYGRGACDRRPGGCDIHAVFDSPTGLIYPAMDTGHLTVRPNSTAHEVLVDKNTGRARGVAFLDSVTRKSYEAKAKVVIVAASTLESARLLLLSRSPQHPNGLGNSSGHVGHNFCEHVMGPGVTGLIKELVGKPHTLDDGRPGGFYMPRFHYQFSDNERKMAEDMVATGREMLEGAGIEVVGQDKEILTEGWSIHELGTARMGNDPKTSVLNEFQQSHDVRNLFVVDGSSHVSASCQNPTWTIMALAWRSCDHLADEFRKGNL